MYIRVHDDGAVETCHRPRTLPVALLLVGITGALAGALGYGRWPLVAVVSLAVFSALCLWTAWMQRVPTRFLFDRRTAVVRWTRPGPLASDAGNGVGQCRFDEVRQVVLQPGPGKHSRSARVALVLGTGLQPLARDFSLDHEQAASIAAQLRELLRLDSAERVTERVLAVADEVGDAAAIAMLRERDGLSEEQAQELLEHLKER